MAKYTSKRKYTKKPSSQLKRVVKKVKKETVEAVTEVPAVTTPVVKTFWEKVLGWFKL